MTSLKDKRVLVVGLGLSGRAAARHCAMRGASVIAVDDKGTDDLGDVAMELSQLGVELSLGRDNRALAEGAELVVASPGIPLAHPLVAAARERGVPVVGEMELAVREIDRPIIAVTGTNGKTTTTSLIGHLLSSSGIRACVAGNIGNPILGDLAKARSSDRVILEVSSFQLDTTPSLRSDIAIWLNATEDHVDRHGSFDAYVASKAKLFTQMGPRGVGIYNVCDDAVSGAALASRARLIPFDAEGVVLKPGAEDIAVSNGCGWYEGGRLLVRIGEGRVHEYPLSKARLKGSHNRENMLAAVLAAEVAGAKYDRIRDALASFAGLPHRVEYVGERAGVTYFDDSKGTNVGATVMALSGFKKPVILIAGGQAKGADLAKLVPAVRDKVKRAILMGEAAPDMERLFDGATVTERAGTMDDAVRAAAMCAEPGDVVLLSPACASFDMYKDYAERGESFKRAVEKL